MAVTINTDAGWRAYLRFAVIDWYGASDEDNGVMGQGIYGGESDNDAILGRRYS